MSDEHTTPAEERLHDEKLEGATDSGPQGAPKHSAIPKAEDGGHDRSVAAHLHEQSHLHDNKNAIQHHVPSQQLREPPQEVTRTGKGHRGE